MLFFYLHSDGYEKINEDHRLSLYLNLCDGFVNNTYKETHNVKYNFEQVIKRTLDLIYSSNPDKYSCKLHSC